MLRNSAQSVANSKKNAMMIKKMPIASRPIHWELPKAAAILLPMLGQDRAQLFQLDGRQRLRLLFGQHPFKRFNCFLIKINQRMHPLNFSLGRKSSDSFKPFLHFFFGSHVLSKLPACRWPNPSRRSAPKMDTTSPTTPSCGKCNLFHWRMCRSFRECRLRGLRLHSSSPRCESAKSLSMISSMVPLTGMAFAESSK